MLARIGAHLRQQYLGAIALFVAVATGGAYAANTVFSEDIADGEVKTPDLANSAVTENKLGEGSVGTGKLKNDAVKGSKVENESLTGADVKADTLAASDLAQNSVGPSELQAALEADTLAVTEGLGVFDPVFGTPAAALASTPLDQFTLDQGQLLLMGADNKQPRTPTSTMGVLFVDRDPSTVPATLKLKVRWPSGEVDQIASGPDTNAQ